MKHRAKFYNFISYFIKICLKWLNAFGIRIGKLDDAKLKDDLQRYVMENLHPKEVLDFVKGYYPQYAWSLGTLDRRLDHFGSRCINYDADIREVEAAVREETNGPGQLLDYPVMHRKIREQHNLAVPRDLVYDIITLVEPEDLERRVNVGKKKNT